MDSILTSIKKLLGITEDYTHFDDDIVLYINTALSILTQLGVGSAEGFAISDATAVWADFVADPTLEMVKSYIGQKVRLLFDPPSSSSVLDSYNRILSELEWRINVAAEEVQNQNG